MKRAFDLTLSLFGLVALAPLLLVIALTVWGIDGRPVFFRQFRVGRGGKLFKIWKFRTMRPAASPEARQVTVEGDTRITWLGSWLRRSKLDELPQLFNVLVGEMSFVGPRPEVEKYVQFYTPRQRRVLDLMPGITDAASIRFRHESELLAGLANPEQVYLESIVPAKIGLNLWYARRANVFRDAGLIAYTLWTLFWGSSPRPLARRPN